MSKLMRPPFFIITQKHSSTLIKKLFTHLKLIIHQPNSNPTINKIPKLKRSK